MRKSIFLIGATAFWLIMMTLLIQKEFLELAPVETPFEVLSFENTDMREEYQGIYLGAQLVGFHFNVLETRDNGRYELRHQTYMTFRFLGHEREMLVKGKASLTSRLHLEDFELRVQSGDYWTHITGQAAPGSLNLVIEGKEGEPLRKTIPVEPSLAYSEALNFIWSPENLKVGKRGRIRAWNPLLMSLEELSFQVTGKETIERSGKNTEAFVVIVRQGEMSTHTWVNPEGTVLRQESPTGLIMKKQEGWQIFDAMRNQRAQLPELPNLFSVPSNRLIQNPETLKKLRVKITTDRQTRLFEIAKESLAGLDKIRLPLSSSLDLTPYLKADAWVQSEDPLIAAKAKAIVGPEKSVLKAAMALHRWTHQNIAPVPTISVPSARDVLAIRKGDCNEYTVLFTALARAAGIPAKMKAGLVYQKGRFFYHAWPEIYLGRWIALDPTLGQAPADVTHIPLVEGSLEEQVGLASKIGKLRLTIMEME